MLLWSCQLSFLKLFAFLWGLYLRRLPYSSEAQGSSYLIFVHHAFWKQGARSPWFHLQCHIQNLTLKSLAVPYFDFAAADSAVLLFWRLCLNSELNLLLICSLCTSAIVCLFRMLILFENAWLHAILYCRLDWYQAMAFEILSRGRGRGVQFTSLGMKLQCSLLFYDQDSVWLSSFIFYGSEYEQLFWVSRAELP